MFWTRPEQQLANAGATVRSLSNDRGWWVTIERPLSAKGWRALGHLVDLAWLFVRLPGWRGDELLGLPGADGLPRLGLLDIDAPLSSAATGTIGRWHSLTVVALDHPVTTPIELERWTDLRRLNALHLRSSVWQGDGLAEVPDLPALTELDVHAPLGGAEVAALGRCRQLQRIALTGMRLSTAALGAWRDLGKLRKLSLTDCALDGAALSALRAVPDLRELMIQRSSAVDWEPIGALAVENVRLDTPLTPAAAAALGASRTLVSVACDGPIDDERLAALVRNPRLEQVKLYDARIGDAAVASLHAHPRLRGLVLGFGPDAADRPSAEALLRLAEARPGCHVSPLGDFSTGEALAARQRTCVAERLRTLRPAPLPDLAAWVDRARGWISAQTTPTRPFDAGTPVTEDRLAALATSLRVALPPPILAALRVTSGLSFYGTSRSEWGHGTDGLWSAAMLASWQDDARAWATETAIRDDVHEHALWLRAFPIAAIPSGDLIALDPGVDEAEPPVVYLTHDGPARPLARSLGDFLGAWEAMDYRSLGWFIRVDEWLDPFTGLLPVRRDTAD